MSARMELHVALSLRLDAIEAYRLANNYRAEVLQEAKRDVVAWLVKKAREGTPIERLADKVDRGAIRIFLETGKPDSRTAAAPDFFQPGHTYTDNCGRVFRCIALTTDPMTGEIRAFGWYATQPGGWPSAEALDPDDYTHMGWTDTATHNTNTGDPA